MAAQKRAKQLLTDLGIPSDIKLSEYEMLIASQLVDPTTVNIQFIQPSRETRDQQSWRRSVWRRR